MEYMSEVAGAVEAAGRLRICLGAAAGPGKTYAMLSEGQRRMSRGRHRRPADEPGPPPASRT
jgi:two-component system, OmpR family, sensor histidine kinase KdpD